MESLELRQRELVINEAMTWLRTPFRNNAALKGSGCDCLGLLVGVFQNIGVVGSIEVPQYFAQWMIHQREEKYVAGLARYTTEVDNPQAGDIALFHFGHTYSHAGIVVKWPVRMIHSYLGRGVEIVDPSRDGQLRRRCEKARFFDPWRIPPRTE